MSTISEDLRVVNLGLPKTGTTTLAEALTRAGMNVADWKIWEGRAAHHGFVGKLMYDGYYNTGDPLHYMPSFNAFTELSITKGDANFWPQMDWGLLSEIRRRYPGTRFLLSWREPNAHADSMRRWSNLGKRRLPMYSIAGLPEGYGKKPGELERWIEGHGRFCRQVFAGADDFLEYDVTDPDAPTKIGAFLGVDLPWWGKANANLEHPGDAPAEEH